MKLSEDFWVISTDVFRNDEKFIGLTPEYDMYWTSQVDAIKFFNKLEAAKLFWNHLVRKKDIRITEWQIENVNFKRVNLTLDFLDKSKDSDNIERNPPIEPCNRHRYIDSLLTDSFHQYHEVYKRLS